MRQTRRSRSSAATPQKDEAPNQVEDTKDEDKSVKTNLETVFEKEGDNNQEVGADVEKTDEGDEGDEPDAEASEENEAPSGDVSSNSELTSDSVIGKQESSPMKATSPKKPDSGVIELNCKVCNISFTNYQEHMNSEAHKSKISHSNPKTDAQGNAEKSAGQKRSGDQDAAPSPKRPRNQSAVDEKFYCDICKLTMLKEQDFDHHMNGKRHMLNVARGQGKSYCDICKLFFNTPVDLNDHNESQLHKTNFENRKQDKQIYECNICKISSTGLRQHEEHLTSKRHKRNLERPIGGAAVNTVNGKVEPKPDAPVRKWLYYCNACNWGSSEDQLFLNHMNLPNHKAASIEMQKKNLMIVNRAARKAAGARAAAAKPGGAQPAATKPAAKPAGPGPKPVGLVNVAQNVRKFPQNNFARNIGAPSGVGANVPNTGGQGAVTKVTYNIVQGNVNASAAAANKGPMKKDGPQVNRKVPAGGPGGPGGPAGLKKNMPVNKPNMAANKPPLSGRPNPRFQGQPGINQPNKIMPNPQPLKLGYQGGNFSSEPTPAGGNFGNYAGRNMGSYVGNMRNDNMNPANDMRGDFRGNARDDYRTDVRDIRDIRDIRSIDMSDNRGDAGFRSGAQSGFSYRDMPMDTGRDVRGDYGGSFRGDLPMDARSDIRSALAPEARGDIRGIARSEMSGDLRSYSNNDIRDLRSDTRADYTRDRSTMAGYGGTSGYGQQNYRGNDDYRGDNYSRVGQSTGQTGSTGNYSVSSGRFDSWATQDRNSSSYSNQYGGSSRGMGYMGDMALNGR